MTAGREQPARRLDASMFPTLPKHGTRLSVAERARIAPEARTEPARLQRPAVKAPASLCDMCGQPSAKPKCGRCWGVVSGLASLLRENRPAYEAFVATIR